MAQTGTDRRKRSVGSFTPSLPFDHVARIAAHLGQHFGDDRRRCRRFRVMDAESPADFLALERPRFAVGR